MSSMQKFWLEGIGRWGAPSSFSNTASLVCSRVLKHWWEEGGYEEEGAMGYGCRCRYHRATSEHFQFRAGRCYT